jgi:aromatic ring hydroxylase
MGEAMALMSKEQYLSSLRDLGHSVFIQGEKVQSVVDHPISRPPAMAMDVDTEKRMRVLRLIENITLGTGPGVFGQSR